MTPDEEVLGSFHGSDEFPIEWAEGEKELLWIFDDLHCPESRLADVLRHRRLVADVRPHVPPLRHPVRQRLDHEEDQRVRLHGGDPGRPGAARARRPSTRRATSHASRAIPTTRPGSAPISASCCRTTRANFLDWWRDRLRPEIEQNFAYLDGYDMEDATPRRARSAARGRDRHPRPPLEDPLDAELRAVLGDDGAERDDPGGQGRRSTRGSSAACRARSTIGTGTRSRRSGG